MLSITVTGGAGYIGSVLVPALLEKGHSVTVLDNFRYGQSSLLACCANERFSIIFGDCRDRATVERAISQADVILPLAAIVGAPACDRDPLAATSINLDAVRLLLSLRSKEQRIVFPGTNSGYGTGEKTSFCTEETPLRPISLYGRGKVEAERAVLDAGNAISLRLATVFGVSPRMRLDLLVNDFVYRALTDRFLIVFEGHFRRNYLHVRDVARAFVHVIDKFDSMRDQAYNLGLSGANHSKLELCEKIQELIPDFVYLQAPVGADPDKRDYIVSNEKIERTGFMPLNTLETGIRELTKAYRMIQVKRYANV